MRPPVVSARCLCTLVVSLSNPSPPPARPSTSSGRAVYSAVRLTDESVGSQCGGVARQIRDARVEGRETGIGGLTLHVAVVDLLDDDGDLEDREDLVIANRGEI